MGKIIDITRSPWSSIEDASPRIGPQEFALKVADAPALRGERQTVALLGAYRLEGRYGLIYGSRIRGALRVIAINPQTGATFFNHAEPMHVEPLERAMNPDARPNPNEPMLVAVEGNFNFDLADQLGLPPEAAEYLVFAWLDDLDSASLISTVPEDKLRPRSRAAPGRVAPPVVKLTTGRAEAVRSEPAISLRALHPKGPGRLFSEVTVTGTAAEEAMPSRPPGKDESSTFLTVMAIGSRNRVLRWHSVDLTDEVVERRGCAFEFNLGLLVDQTDPPQQAFVMAVVGDTRSPVLVVDPLNPAPAAP